jgi:hypothetical protein
MTLASSINFENTQHSFKYKNDLFRVNSVSLNTHRSTGSLVNLDICGFDHWRLKTPNKMGYLIS